MRKKRRLLWQLYPTYLSLILLSLLAAGWYTSRSLNSFYIDRNRAELETHAHVIEGRLQQKPVTLGNSDMLEAFCKDFGKAAAIRLTIILPNGVVVGDSDELPGHMENHGNRPEIISALQGETGTSIRFSHTLQQNMMYLAIPLEQNGRVAAIIRTALPLTDIENTIRSLQLEIGFFGFIIAIVAAGICLLISQRISRPIESMTRGAQRFAKGDLKHRLSSPDTRELFGLSRALNQMAEELENRMDVVVNQRNEYEAVLTSMVEGVIAINMEQRIMSINRAAAGMLSVVPDEMKGRGILEAVRNRELHRFITEALDDGNPKEGDVILHQVGEQVMHTQCIPLNDTANHRIGTLVVMHDVSRVRQLENIRRDFVANVSHEIKTPLTAIKGFVETLQNGTADTPEEQEKFLGIIKKHADRLHAIVEDLLALARLEQREGRDELHIQHQSAEKIIETAVQMVKPKADEKEIPIRVTCDESLEIAVDTTLMEQAIVNLLDNAVKYSPKGSPVHVEARSTPQELSIHVADQGPGISRNHLPRLFERFYRVDRARSRSLGGTGLGLAIVKHIAQVHGGKVSVESTLGKGSTFSISLPRKSSWTEADKKS